MCSLQAPKELQFPRKIMQRHPETNNFHARIAGIPREETCNETKQHSVQTLHVGTNITFGRCHQACLDPFCCREATALCYRLRGSGVIKHGWLGISRINGHSNHKQEGNASFDLQGVKQKNIEQSGRATWFDILLSTFCSKFGATEPQAKQ